MSWRLAAGLQDWKRWLGEWQVTWWSLGNRRLLKHSHRRLL